MGAAIAIRISLAAADNILYTRTAQQVLRLPKSLGRSLLIGQIESSLTQKSLWGYLRPA